MLIHKRSLSRSRDDESDGEGDLIGRESAQPSARPTTPVYPRDPTRYCPQVLPRRQGPRQSRDRLLELMRDEGYHHAGEMEALLPGGEWVAAMRELSRDYYFDRRGDSFKIRYRLRGDEQQVLVRLLAGVDATRRSPPAAEPPEGPEEDGSGSEELSLLDEEPDPMAGSPLVGDPLPEDAMSVAVDPGDLPLSAAEFVGGTHAILAHKNYGKTYLGMVLVEEVSRNSGAQVVVVDPMGAWAPGLRAMADGTPSGFRCLTFGGPHADVEITSKQGRQVAEAVRACRPCSVVVDLSQVDPEGQHEFVADMVGSLFTTWDREPVHVVLDEADEFAPQVLTGSSHQKRSLVALDRLVRRGRIKGFGSTLITQRAAALSKNLLTQVDDLFLLHVMAPQDLQAVDDWMKYVVDPGRRAECLRALPSLAVGHSYFLRGGERAMFSRFVTRRRLTFDSSRTPRAGEVAVEPVLAPPPEGALAEARRVVLGQSSSGAEEGEES